MKWQHLSFVSCVAQSHAPNNIVTHCEDDDSNKSVVLSQVEPLCYVLVLGLRRTRNSNNVKIRLPSLVMRLVHNFMCRWEVVCDSVVCHGGEVTC